MFSTYLRTEVDSATHQLFRLGCMSSVSKRMVWAVAVLSVQGRLLQLISEDKSLTGFTSWHVHSAQKSVLWLDRISQLV